MSIRDVKSSYKMKEWADREEYYIDQMDNITIATQPTTTEIKEYISLIDELLTEALLDLAYIERVNAGLDRKIKNLKESLYITIKQGASGKLTEAEVKSLVMNKLEKDPYTQDSTATIFDVLDIAEKRYIFIKRVVEMLKEKKASIITENAMLKIEAGIQ